MSNNKLTKKEKYPYFLGIGFDEKLNPYIRNNTGFENGVQMLTAMDVVKNKLLLDCMSKMVDVKNNKLLLDLTAVVEGDNVNGE